MELIGTVIGIVLGVSAIAGSLWKAAKAFNSYQAATDQYTKNLIEIKNEISKMEKMFDDYKMLNDSRIATIQGRLDAEEFEIFDKEN